MPLKGLYRLASVAGVVAAVILLLNAGRRGGVIPELDLTHALAPVAEIASLFLVLGLYLSQRQRIGIAGFVGYVLNAVGLAGLVGVEFVLNLIFPALSAAQIDTIRHGVTGTMFTLTSLVFLVGVLVFGSTLWLPNDLPRAAILLYAVGSIPIGLRGVLPVATLVPGLILVAIGISWLSVHLWRHAPRIAEAEPQDQMFANGG